MIVTEIADYTKTKVKVCLDNRTDFQLYKKEINKYNIVEGEEITNYDEILNETLIPRAKKRAIHLIEKMDRTESDLRRKLIKNGYPKEAIDEAISYVKSYNYVNDKRYACMYVRNYRDSRTMNRISDDMYRKGIDKELIMYALAEEYTTDEEDSIDTFIRKRNYNKDTATMKERDKMFRFLAGKGFELDMIRRHLTSTL